MKIRTALTPLLVVLISCCASPDRLAHAADTASADITAVLDNQKNAWNQGDIDKFMTAYANSPETSYVSGGTYVSGYGALEKRYKAKYGSSRDSMGQLSFSNLKITDLSKTSALCVGNWHLTRKDSPDADGIFSLVLVHKDKGWKIIHDHTSLTPADLRKSTRSRR